MSHMGRDRLPTPDSSTQQPPAPPLPPPPAPPLPRAVKTKDRYKSPAAVPKPLPLRQQREKKRGWPCRPDVMRHALTCPCSVLVRQFTGNHSYSCDVWGSHACWKRLGRGPSADFPTGCDITQSGPALAHNSGGRRLKGDTCDLPTLPTNGWIDRGEYFGSSVCPSGKQNSKTPKQLVIGKLTQVLAETSIKKNIGLFEK